MVTNVYWNPADEMSSLKHDLASAGTSGRGV